MICRSMVFDDKRIGLEIIAENISEDEFLDKLVQRPLLQQQVSLSYTLIPFKYQIVR